uniref:NaTx n=1 Tax=Centruroides hentzi TaxID=88313 RepID=A0A2I9LP95_9SCOR
MKTFILFISCLMVIDEVVESKDGFLVGSDGCFVKCYASDVCENATKSFNANECYCNAIYLACYCYGLPSDVKVSGDDYIPCDHQYYNGK